MLKRTREERLQRVLDDIAAQRNSQDTCVIDSSQDDQRLEFANSQDINAVCNEIKKKRIKKVIANRVTLSFSTASTLVDNALSAHPTTETLLLPVFSAIMNPSQVKLMRFEHDLLENVAIRNSELEIDEAAYVYFSTALKNRPGKQHFLSDDLLNNTLKAYLVAPRKNLQII